jgi:voltage-gated potassium channel
MNSHPLPGGERPLVDSSNTDGPAERVPEDWPQLRHLAVALARTLGSITAVVVLYYLLPLGKQFRWTTVLALLAGLVFVALLTTWQVRSVLRSPHPGLRAAETLALTVPLFLVLFAASYQVLAATEPSAFSEPLSRTDGLYFVVTVFATVGFGDISPVSDAARILTSVQMLGDLVVIGLVVKAILTAVERGRADRGSEARSSAVARSNG